MDKTPTSLNLSAAAHALLAEISRYEGVGKADVIEMLLRQRARELSIPIPAPPPEDPGAGI